MLKAYKITVTGRVQGVWFRASTKQTADDLGLKGIVKNKKDGSVYIEVEGDQKSIEEFIAWVQHGPEFAKVDQCETEEQKTKSYVDFKIIRKRMSFW